jgi:dynactin complex subunit
MTEQIQEIERKIVSYFREEYEWEETIEYIHKMWKYNNLIDRNITKLFQEIELLRLGLGAL